MNECAPLPAGLVPAHTPVLRGSAGSLLRRCGRARKRGGGAGVAAVVSVAGGQGLTFVPISAQLELTLPISAHVELTLSTLRPKLARGCVPKVVKLSSNVSDVSRRSSS